MSPGKFIKIILFIAFLPVTLPVWLIAKLFGLSFNLLFNFEDTLNTPLGRDDGSFKWNGKIW